MATPTKSAPAARAGAPAPAGKGKPATAAAVAATSGNGPARAAVPAAGKKAAAAPAAGKGKPGAPATKAGTPAATKAPAASARPRVGATEEELEAAVKGQLKPRKTPGAPNQDALTLHDENGRPKGRPIGVTTGLPILLAWSYVFQQNEKAKKSEKMTDEQISQWMKAEFPGRNTPAFDHPATCRLDYNAGRFTKGTPPDVASRRYDATGTPIDPGTRAKRAGPKKAAEIRTVGDDEAEADIEAEEEMEAEVEAEEDEAEEEVEA